jgi:murein DD-endopeptidase MepM/ murein hydrolase activator NlpD
MRSPSAPSFLRPSAVARFAIVVVTLTASAGAAAPAAAEETGMRPVAGAVARHFQAPVTRYGRGHLGVDFHAAPGTPVHAIESGIIVFAGRVGGARHVVERDARGRRLSYSFLASVVVRTGERVRPGRVLGTTGGKGEHHDGNVLHIGLRIGDTYVDPMQLFGASGLPIRVHLVPAGSGSADSGSLSGSVRSLGGVPSAEGAALVGAGSRSGPPIVLPAPAPSARRSANPIASVPPCVHWVSLWCAQPGGSRDRAR